MDTSKKAEFCLFEKVRLSGFIHGLKENKFSDPPRQVKMCEHLLLFRFLRYQRHPPAHHLNGFSPTFWQLDWRCTQRKQDFKSGPIHVWFMFLGQPEPKIERNLGWTSQWGMRSLQTFKSIAISNQQKSIGVPASATTWNLMKWNAWVNEDAFVWYLCT